MTVDAGTRWASCPELPGHALLLLTIVQALLG